MWFKWVLEGCNIRNNVSVWGVLLFGCFGNLKCQSCLWWTSSARLEKADCLFKMLLSRAIGRQLTCGALLVRVVCGQNKSGSLILCTSGRKTLRFRSILTSQRSCRKVGVTGNCLRVWIFALQAGTWDSMKYTGHNGYHFRCSYSRVLHFHVSVFAVPGVSIPQVSGVMHVLLLLRHYGIWLLLTLKTIYATWKFQVEKFLFISIQISSVSGVSR